MKECRGLPGGMLQPRAGCQCSKMRNGAHTVSLHSSEFPSSAPYSSWSTRPFSSEILTSHIPGPSTSASLASRSLIRRRLSKSLHQTLCLLLYPTKQNTPRPSPNAIKVTEMTRGIRTVVEVGPVSGLVDVDWGACISFGSL
jgi:hypothetical protein